MLLTRSALLGQLDRSLQLPFTHISAPAGTGKTVLLTQWAERLSVPVTWIRLGPADPPEAAVDALNALGDRGLLEPLPPRDACLDPNGHPSPDLVRALQGAPEHVVIIDDDREADPDRYYPLVGGAIAATPDCAFHLIVASRTAPHPDLAALRLRDVALLLGERDLRLTDDEAAALVEKVTGAPVDPALAAALNAHHLGWVTGVALAARSWPNQADPTLDLVVAASSEAVDDYLMSEVVAPLPAPIRSWLSRVAALPVLSVDLCDAATESSGSGEVLTWLRRRGVFVRPSARGADWWICHPQLRWTLVANEAPADRAAREATLRVAAVRYAEANLLSDAVRCLADLRDWDAIRLLISGYGHTLFTDNRLDELIALFQEMPASVYQRQLPWAIALAGIKLLDGQVAASNDLLARVSPLLEADDVLRADCVRIIGIGWADDAVPFIDLAETGLVECDRLGDDHVYVDVLNVSHTDHYRTLLRFGGLLAGAYAGQWARVAPLDGDIRPDTRMEMHPMVLCGLVSQRAACRVLAGDARAARTEATAALDVAQQVGLGEHPFLNEAYASIGEAHRLAGRVDDAVAALERALDLASGIHRHNAVALVVAFLAHLDVDRGRPAEALARIVEHRDVAHRRPWTVTGYLAAAEARALTALGRPDAARDVLAAGPRTTVAASAAVALALADGAIEEARAAVDAWPDEPTVGGDLRRTLARAAVHEASGDPGDADAQLDDALVAARAIDVVQPFAELGPALAGPLRRIGVGPSIDTDDPFLARISRAVLATGGPATLPLSAQELTVLGHLARERTLPQVAGDMYLSVNTVKTHVRAIYRKLGVRSRAEALIVWQQHVAGGG